MSLSLNKCNFCKYLNYNDQRNFPTCVAFPDGIPIEKERSADEEECANGIKFEEENEES